MYCSISEFTLSMGNFMVVSLITSHPPCKQRTILTRPVGEKRTVTRWELVNLMLCNVMDFCGFLISLVWPTVSNSIHYLSGHRKMSPISANQTFQLCSTSDLMSFMMPCPQSDRKDRVPLDWCHSLCKCEGAWLNIHLRSQVTHSNKFNLTYSATAWLSPPLHYRARTYKSGMTLCPDSQVSWLTSHAKNSRNWEHRSKINGMFSIHGMVS